MADGLTIEFKLNDRVYSLKEEDLELGEVEWLEEEMGAALEDIDFNRVKALTRLMYLMVHRENPDFTLEDAKAMKATVLSDLVPVSQNGDSPSPAKRPTKAAKGGS